LVLRTGATLPKHQIGFGSDHIGVKPLEHIDDFFAADTTVEYGDRVAGKTLLEFDGEAAGVGRCRPASTFRVPLGIGSHADLNAAIASSRHGA
jgi:hypothetical protein